MTFNYFDIKDENDEDNSFSNEELNKKIYKKSFNERTNVSKKIKRIGFNMDQEFGKINQLELDINSCNIQEELLTINYDIYDNNK